MLDHLTSRVDAKREPVAGDEILPCCAAGCYASRGPG